MEQDLDSGVGAWEVMEVWLRDRPLARVVAVGAVILLTTAIIRGSWKSAIPAMVVVAMPSALLLLHNNHLDGHVWYDFRMVPMIIGTMLLVLTVDMQKHKRNNIAIATKQHHAQHTDKPRPTPSTTA